MKELLRPTALSALLALAPLCAPAQTPDTHRHRFGDAEKWAKVFDDPERDAWQKPHEVIEALALAPDAVVADIGSGTGYFAARLARFVPKGRVYGVDTEPGMVKYLAERARREGLANLVSIAGRPADARLPAGFGEGPAEARAHLTGAREGGNGRGRLRGGEGIRVLAEPVFPGLRARAELAGVGYFPARIIASMNFSESIMAALIAAGATVLTALVQLRMHWRRELKERERGQPITKKARRGPVLFVFALMIAAAVGGFALSQYFLSLRNGDRDTLRSELRSRLSEISASAARLEHARLGEREQVEAAARRAEALRLGEEGAAASVVVGPCKREAVPGDRRECTEQSAVRVAICARVPAAATVKEVQLYARFEDSKQSWQESRVQAGQDAGQARFADKFTEWPDGDAGKQVCQGFLQWNRERSRVARILVKYAP